MSLEKIEDFHGHLGPYAVLGYRMGLIANAQLGADPFAKTATVMTGTVTPISCMIDGIQLSSGCTLGKGNISVEDRKEPRAVFKQKKGQRVLEISLKHDIHDRIKSGMTRENTESLAKEFYSMADEKLFDIKEG